MTCCQQNGVLEAELHGNLDPVSVGGSMHFNDVLGFICAAPANASTFAARPFVGKVATPGLVDLDVMSVAPANTPLRSSAPNGDSPSAAARTSSAGGGSTTKGQQGGNKSAGAAAAGGSNNKKGKGYAGLPDEVSSQAGTPFCCSSSWP
jgi:hypothetical protein